MFTAKDGTLPLLWISRDPTDKRTGAYTIILVDRYNKEASKIKLIPSNSKLERVVPKFKTLKPQPFKFFSFNLQGNLDSNFLFSPNFERMIDIDYAQ